MPNKKMPCFELDVDCLDFDIKGISLCDKTVHNDSMVTLSVTMGVEISMEQLVELLRRKQELDNHQFWKLRFTQADKK